MAAAIWFVLAGVLPVAAMQAQAPAEVATAACYVQPDGTLKVIALGFGEGYASAPRVSLTHVPAGASATVVAGTPVEGEIRSYQVTESHGWPQTISFAQICPALVQVDAPVQQPALRAMAAMPMSRAGAAALTLRVDDFGAVGDGVTDDRKAIQAAFDAAEAMASQSPGQNPKVSFTSGKTYFVGSIGGYYWGAFDDGSVPVAAELRCSARGGVVSGCTVVHRGEGLNGGRTPLVFPVGGTGRGAAIRFNLADCTQSTCTHGTGSYVASATGTGGSGYPDVFTVYVGPTCGGVACQYLPPETPARIAYGVRLPNNVTIEGNGATVTGGFKGAAASAADYTNDFPYMATFANIRSGNDEIRDLTFMNVFIGIGNLGAFMNLDNLGFGAAIAIQGQQAQYVNIHKLNFNCRVCVERAGIVVGGQWGTRSPLYGGEQDWILNTLNIGDALRVQDYMFFQQDANGRNQKALDCWFDRNFFHLEDQGMHNAMACYQPPGGVTRMTDQDLSSQREPDDMWRGIYGIPLAIYTRYGRQTNDAAVDNLQAKGNMSYVAVLGPNIVMSSLKNVGTEGGGYCDGKVIYGSAACPNPYEPFASQPLGVILTDSRVMLDSAPLFYPYESVLTYPWQIAPSIEGGISYSVKGASTGHLSDPESVPGNRGREFGPQSGWMHGQEGSNADSEAAQFEGSHYTFRAEPDTWLMRVHDVFQPRNYPALMEIRALDQQDDSGGRAYLKTSGLAVDPKEVQNGQVTALQITDPGAGYPAFANVGCAMAPSTNQNVTMGGGTTAFQATCYGVTDATGKLARLYVSAPGLGYLIAPTVTLEAPPAGGQLAMAKATIARMQTYVPVGHMVIDSFYLPTGGVVSPGTSTTLSHLPCPDANGIASSGSAMQDHVTVISMGGQNWGVPGVIVTALATGSGQCSVTLNNPTATPLQYGAGTEREPWELLIMGAASGGEQAAGFGPQGALASQVATSVTASAGNLAATTGNVGGGRMAAGCTVVGTLRIPGADSTMACVMSGRGGNPPDVMPQCAVTGQDAVELELCAASPTMAAARQYNVRVLR